MERKETNFYDENVKLVSEVEVQCCHWLGLQGFI